MSRQGRVMFSRMDEVVFGQPAAGAVAELAARRGAERVLVMASATLDRETGCVAGIRAALGPRLAAQYQGMPAHSPRAAVLEATAAARRVDADLIVTIGGGSITDAAKAVQLCLANGIDSVEAMDRLRPGGAALLAPRVRQIAVPTTLSAGEFSAVSGVTDERSRVKELFRHPDIIPAAVVLDPAMTLPRRNGCFSPPASAQWIIAWRGFAPPRRILTPMPRRCAGWGCWPRGWSG